MIKTSGKLLDEVAEGVLQEPFKLSCCYGESSFQGNGRFLQK